MPRAFLGLGSNLGDRRAHLRRAVSSLPDVVAVSAVYETEPVGGPDQGRFLNCVVELETRRSPRELLGLAHALEKAARRVRLERWGPRTLDVDGGADAAHGTDLVVIATPDAAIAEVAQAVRPVESTVVAHLAGSLGLDVLAPHARRASLHPLVPLADPEVGSRQLEGAWFAI